MKILLVSMPSIHVVRWVENIDQSKHELFWFDILDRGFLRTPLIPRTHQFVDWQKRKRKHIKGEFFLSKKAPKIHGKLQPHLEVSIHEKLTEIINMIQPNVLHSFEMQSCSYPILKTMNKFPYLRWIYSCWGSDLFYYGGKRHHRFKIKKVLKRVNYLLTDCKRDYSLAIKYGFSGKYLGTIFGGGGFKLKMLSEFRIPLIHRKIILVKGYEHQFGRAINVIKALQAIPKELSNYEVHVYATHEIVQKFIESNQLPFKIYGRHNLNHNELLALMGKSLVSIGNSMSDGVPNTLLESIIMGAFPIQSNPGKASQEFVNHNVNGLLINNAESITEIKKAVIKALNTPRLLEKAYKINTEDKASKMDFQMINENINKVYMNVEYGLDYII